MENLLLKPVKITLKDRTTNLLKNLKRIFWEDNRGKMYCAVTAGVVTLTSYSAYGLLTLPHRRLGAVRTYLNGLNELLSTAEDNNMNLQSQDSMKPVLAIIEEEAKQHPCEEIQTIETLVNESCAALNQGDLPKTISLVEIANDKIQHICMPTGYIVGVMLGSIASVVCGLFFGFVLKDGWNDIPRPGDGWQDYFAIKRRDAQIHELRLKEKREEILKHPFAQQIYDFFDVLQQRNKFNKTLALSIYYILLEFNDSKYKQVFEDIAQLPDKPKYLLRKDNYLSTGQYTNPADLRIAFENFHYSLEEEKMKNYKIDEPKQPQISSELELQRRMDELCNKNSNLHGELKKISSKLKSADEENRNKILKILKLYECGQKSFEEELYKLANETPPRHPKNASRYEQWDGPRNIELDVIG